MSFLFKKLKKKDKEPKGFGKMSKEVRRLYYTAEFNCFGDMTNDGFMSIEEFYRLMMLLGYPKGKDGARRLWKSKGKPEGAKMSLEEYITMMFDPKVDSKTNSWRKLFAEFDTDGSGSASRAEVLQGLEKMGFDSAKAKAQIDSMDTNKDGKVCYAEFLKLQLRQ